MKATIYLFAASEPAVAKRAALLMEMPRPARV